MSENPRRILVVGFAQDLRESIIGYLRDKYGYVVDSGDGADEPWLKPAADNATYDVLLIDESSATAAFANTEPSLNELISRIRLGCPNTECIFLTKSRTEQTIEIFQTGVYQYPMPASSFEELGVLICLAIEQSRLRREKDRLFEELQRNQEELKLVKGLVGARTALAWMGMVTSAWRHAINNHAVSIRDSAQLLSSELKQRPQVANTTALGLVDTIEHLAKLILAKPITPPLSAETGVEPVSVGELISERARLLWQYDQYKKAVLKLEIQCPDSVTVFASPVWLRRVFDILVDNAVDAIADSGPHVVTIGTRVTSGRVEMFVSDTGSGIPEDIKSRIGLERIEKPQDPRRLGVGLLMAQVIAQTYSGEIYVESTGHSGTTVVMSLPIHEAGQAKT
ncbi:C4-dicarboxylate transport sensor protein DctB [Methylococcales bacterium]|nr:C4-dicarboxylate transport sensor protein DctB [Methylococcales bacterium]